MEDALEVVSDEEKIQLRGVLLEEGDHGMIRDKHLVWEVEDRNVLLASLRDRVCNLIAGAWNNFTAPHWALACTHHVVGGRFLASTHHVVGGRFLISRLSGWASL